MMRFIFLCGIFFLTAATSQDVSISESSLERIERLRHSEEYRRMHRDYSELSIMAALALSLNVPSTSQIVSATRSLQNFIANHQRLSELASTQPDYVYSHIADFLMQGADPDAFDPTVDFCLLYSLVLKEEFSFLVKFFLTNDIKRANPNIKNFERHSFHDFDGYTALHRAVYFKNEEAVRVLLSCPETNLDIREDSLKKTPLELARSREEVEPSKYTRIIHLLEVAGQNTYGIPINR